MKECLGLYQLLCFLLLPLLISFQPTLSTNSTTQLCSNDQRSALLQFKTHFSINETDPINCYGSYPKTNSWKEDTDCCLWDGIGCDNITGHVISLDLSCSWLYGTIPSYSTLFLLSDLQRLDLSFNDFQNSQIPSNFGGFASLTHLDLSRTRFGGQVPYEISYLSKLIFLDLSTDSDPFSNNYILGRSTLNGIVRNLTEVREINLDGIDLSSVDPMTFMNLSYSLTSLSMSYCDLRGNFLEYIFNLPNIMHIRMDGNPRLIGLFPKSNQSIPLEVLLLSKTSLSGELPESIGNLKSLKGLSLINSRFSGPIPKSLGNLSQLEFLFLAFNNFSGKIPFSLTNLTKLGILNICCNRFEGSIPDKINAFPNLGFLDLSLNLLSGKTPSWLYTHPSLTFLFLKDNRFGGIIKEFQQNILEAIDFSDNSFQGSIPSSISKLLNLTFLDLSANSLTGTVGFGIFSKLENLSTLDLSFNALSISFDNKVNFSFPYLRYAHLSSCNISEFPSFLEESKDLYSLDLSNNRIHDQIPPSFLKESIDLYFLNLSNNRIHGQIPPSFLKENIMLKYLDLSNNRIHGHLPIHSHNIQFLSVLNNNLSGEIYGVCHLNSVQILDLSHNKFNGTIPKCIGSLTKSLSSLNLNMNEFHGIIPAIFANGCGLSNLNLNSNHLEGPLTRRIRNCKDLEVLDLGNNKLNGSFPHWVGALPKLQVLVLHSNKFRGVISASENPRSLHRLRIFDLSSNNFTGPLPTSYIRNFTGMINVDEGKAASYMRGESSRYDYSTSVVVKGLQIELDKILTIFTSIDLSNNSFEGEIPGIIGELHSLLGLNLSHNKLVGQIPPSLGNLSKLEWLDLSSNKLVGQIPRELVSLTFLSSFNVSYNQLVGLIPQGKQFNTFENSSYEGNEGLYGCPLSRGCNNNEASPSPRMNSHKEDGSNYSKIEFGWKVVAIGYGFGFILGVPIGCVALQMGKPKWLMNLIS